MMRLDRFLTETGVGSRSDVKKLIAKGRISVNGEVRRDPAGKIAEETDLVCCDGVRIRFEKFVYFMLNKPQGVISESRRSKAAGGTEKDAPGPGRTVTCIDLIREEGHRDLFPVGRLDKDTEGLLLITDDGQLAHELLSPRKHVDKVYYVELERPLSEADRLKVEAGVDIGDEDLTLPAKIRMLPGTQQGTESEMALRLQRGAESEMAPRMQHGAVAGISPDIQPETQQETQSAALQGKYAVQSAVQPEMPSASTTGVTSGCALEIMIHEGRFHQIKRMFEAVGNKVVFLKRLRMGTLELDGSLAPGEYRRLIGEELDGLRSRQNPLLK